MKNYKWILFDADETLFRFDAFAGLKLMFSNYNVQFDQDDYHAYEKINKPLWVDYQNGSITAQDVYRLRFENWATKLNVASLELNNAFMHAMAELCSPLDGAINLIRGLKQKHRLGIITNGFSELQKIRLQRTGLTDHFEFVIISEEVGFAKPHPNIFNHALELMQHPDRSEVLMVGDTLESDILGGINVGFDTCWLNQHNKTAPEHIQPSYHVTHLDEISVFLLGDQ